MPNSTLFVIVKSEATSYRDCLLVLCSILYFFFVLCFFLWSAPLFPYKSTYISNCLFSHT